MSAAQPSTPAPAAAHVLAAPPIEPAERSCCGRTMSAVLGRFLMLENVYELELWPSEVEAVGKNYADVPLSDRPLATRYLCWRRSVLGCALVPYALSLALRIRTVAGSLNKAEFLQSISPETDLIEVEDYYAFFESYFYVHAAVQVLYAVSLVGSLLLMMVAFSTWSSFRRSRRWLRSAYLLSFAVPYLLLMIAPYKQAIDGEGAELKLCEDMMLRGNESLSQAQFECSLPSAKICKQPSDRWAPAVNKVLEECGVMRDPSTGTCPFAAQYAERALQANSLAASDLEPTVQQLCEADTGCFPCIEPTTAANGGATCSNIALAVAGPRSERDRCARCFEPVAEWRSPSPPTVSLTAQQWIALEAAGVGAAGDSRCGEPWRFPSCPICLCAPPLGQSTAFNRQLQQPSPLLVCSSANVANVANAVGYFVAYYVQTHPILGCVCQSSCVSSGISSQAAVFWCRVCAQICAPLLVPDLSAQYAAQLSGGGSYCVSEEMLSVMTTITALALHFDKVRKRSFLAICMLYKK